MATATVLTAAPDPAISGQSVTFTATVTPAPTGTPAGTVSFYSGSTLLGTADVNSSGVATFTSTSLSAGDLSITAAYSGNAVRRFDFKRNGAGGGYDVWRDRSATHSPSRRADPWTSISLCRPSAAPLTVW